MEIARKKKGDAKAEFKVWRGGKKKLKEWRSEEGAGNREENEERREERVRGTVMAKGGQREGGYVCAVRRERHKILEARLEAARMERKLEKVTRGRLGQEEQEPRERKKEEGEVGRLGKVDVEEWKGKAKKRKDGEEGTVEKDGVTERVDERGSVKGESDKMSWWEMWEEEGEE